MRITLLATPSILQWTKLPIVFNTNCKKTYGTLFKPDTMVCAGNGIQATCKGDSGGPLACVKNGRVHLVGLTMMGICGNGFPSIFTRVSSYLPWIKSQMG